jgi:hypothetical protein
MHLRHERLHSFATLHPTTMNVFPDRALANIGSVLITQALPDPLGGVTLLARPRTSPLVIPFLTAASRSSSTSLKQSAASRTEVGMLL